MTRQEAEKVLREHKRFMQGDGEYYFTSIPPYSMDEVKQAKLTIFS